MVAICPHSKRSGFQISDPIQNPDHLRPNLFWTIQNPDKVGFQICTVFRCFRLLGNWFSYPYYIKASQLQKFINNLAYMLKWGHIIDPLSSPWIAHSV